VRPVIAIDVDQSDIGKLASIETAQRTAALCRREARRIDPGKESVRHPHQRRLEG
jgi:hypothetical protein